MNTKSKPVSISATSIEEGLWQIRRSIMLEHGDSQASRDTDPLWWYVATGRASVAYIRALLSAPPDRIGQLLHKGGSIDEALKRVRRYLTSHGLLDE